MKFLQREFTQREKALLFVLFFLLLALAYFRLIDQYVRTQNATLDSEISSMEMQVDTMSRRLAEIKKMQRELNDMDEEGKIPSYMPSYNSEKSEVDFLNNTLSQASDYYVGFSDVTREEAQVRRNFSLQYAVPNYKSAIDILKKLEASRTRCQIKEVAVAPNIEGEGSIMSNPLQVSATATFFETMHGGEEDSQLKEIHKDE